MVLSSLDKRSDNFLFKQGNLKNCLRILTTICDTLAKKSDIRKKVLGLRRTKVLKVFPPPPD